MLAEMERVAAGEAMPPVDMRKTELPPPPKSKRNDVAAWQAALDNACAQYEHQKTRLENLELLSKHGPQIWAMRTKCVWLCPAYCSSELSDSFRVFRQTKQQEEALRGNLAKITYVST